MHEIGKKAIYYIEELNQNWNKLQKLNSNIPKSLKLYGLFMLKIYDDKEKGEQMIRRFKYFFLINIIILNHFFNLFFRSRNIQNGSNQNEGERQSFYNQSFPMIMISGDHVRNIKTLKF